ncbi:hypothetical protein DYB37_000942 [Aphanomyces astaci]|uniref:Anaphase-promoting complex subunit 4 n=1 Tax=Aphanomyces astaci TaxID=112090 RepID=A0A3R6XC11_APHAT|nr:hypothetical protein DYB35_000151 [Aphanomyces astaci]RHZ17509.1 hypothetical protein DYB37_000942 [Aphanomyces astaci]
MYSITDCNSSKMKDRTPSYVMNPPSSFSDTSTTYTPISPIPDEHHHVLASADTHGTILVHLWGNVCLARVDTSVTNIQHLYVLQDLSRVHVATITGQVVSYRLPTSTSKEILFVVAHHIREIQSLWAMITSALKQLKTEMHMYTLLCSGLCYPALELFLSQYLQAQATEGFLLQLNRMQRAVRDTAVNMGLFLDWIAHTSASVTSRPIPFQ